MGSITRSLSNNITTGGVILPAGITNSSVSAVTSFANASGGTLILINTQTASSSATISFTTGLNSTYDEYIFKFINIKPATDNTHFQFNLSTDSGSNYNIIKTSSFFESYQNEAGTQTSLNYQGGYDLAQSTSYQTISYAVGGSSDECIGGSMQLFNPSSATYVKHYISKISHYNSGDYAGANYCAGYGNNTSAVNAVRFQFSSGNINDGIIKLYGVRKS
jgi:hypothetical protein